MAITHKSIETRAEKAYLRREAGKIIARAREASQKVPQDVIAGDARMAVGWRDAAETALYVATAPPDSLTLVKMRARVAELKNLLSVIENPSELSSV